MIDKWIITISGFTQDLEKETGIELLWKDLRRYSCHNSCVTLPLVWNSDWEAVAKFIRRNSSENPTIFIVAYSWGCGQGFVQLSRYLSKFGFKVKHAVLCDPVYKPKLWVLSWVALTNFKKVKVYSNVERVTWFKQTKNLPKGHELKIMGENTVVDDPVFLDYTHQEIDNAPEFHDKVKELMEYYFGGST